MKLIQSGPETDAAGEPITRTLATSDVCEELKAIANRVARNYGFNDALWINIPLGSSRWFLGRSRYITFGIKP